jgi:hypothetical protein
MSSNIALLVEKVISTYVQSVIGLIILDLNDTLSTSTPTALAIAALPAAITVLTASLPVVSERLPFYVALLGNTARTFVQGFLGFLLAQQVFTLDVSIGQAAAFAALPAALAVLKAGIATRVGDPNTPNLLPADVDPAGITVADV